MVGPGTFNCRCATVPALFVNFVNLKRAKYFLSVSDKRTKNILLTFARRALAAFSPGTDWPGSAD